MSARPDAGLVRHSVAAVKELLLAGDDLRLVTALCASTRTSTSAAARPQNSCAGGSGFEIHEADVVEQAGATLLNAAREAPLRCRPTTSAPSRPAATASPPTGPEEIIPVDRPARPRRSTHSSRLTPDRGGAIAPARAAPRRCRRPARAGHGAGRTGASPARSSRRTPSIPRATACATRR
jgi:hypothetical protein